MIASILRLAARILGYGSYRNLPDTLYDRPDRTEELPDGRIRRKWFRRTVLRSTVNEYECHRGMLSVAGARWPWYSSSP